MPSRSLDWLTGFPDATWRTVQLRANQILFRQGDPVLSLFVVRTGTIQLIRHTTDGSRVLLHTARAGQAIAEASLFAEAYHCDAVAVTQAQLTAHARPAILAAMTADPALSLRFARHLAHQVRDLRSRLELRDIRSASERLLAWLRLHARGEPPVVRADPDWSTVADEVGLRREVLYRALASLAASGHIHRDGRTVALAGGDVGDESPPFNGVMN